MSGFWRQSICSSLIVLVFAASSAFAADTLLDVAIRDAKIALQAGNAKRALELFDLASKESSSSEDRAKQIEILNGQAESYLLLNEKSKAKSAYADSLFLCINLLEQNDPLFLKTREKYEELKRAEKADQTEHSAEIKSDTKDDTSPVQTIVPVAEPIKNSEQVEHGEIELITSEGASISGSVSNLSPVSKQSNQFAWSCADPSCNRHIVDGNYVESINAGKMLVSAVLFDTGRKYRVDVCVKNGDTKPFDIFPENIALSVIGKTEIPLKLEPAEKLGAAVVNCARFNAAVNNFANAMNEVNASQQRVYNTSFVPMSGSFSSFPAGFGTYSGYATITTSSPNLAATAVAINRSNVGRQIGQSQVAAAEAGANAINDLALKPNTVDPGAMVAGAVFFRKKGNERCAQVTVALPSGDYVFNFELQKEHSGKRLVKALWYGPECFRTIETKDVLNGRSAKPAISE